KVNLPTLTSIFATIPTRYWKDRSANLMIILVGLTVSRDNIAYKEYGMRFMLAPRSARALHEKALLKLHGMRKLPGSPSFGGTLFLTKHRLEIFFMLRKGLDFSEESIKKSWGKNQLMKVVRSSSYVLIVPSFSSSSHVFVSPESDRGNIISFDSNIELVSFDKSQVVTFNGKFVYGFKNGDCRIESQSNNMVDSPHGFIIYGIKVLKGKEKVTKVKDIQEKEKIEAKTRQNQEQTKSVENVGNKMHKAFPLLGESSHWQYKFPLPVEGVPTARRMEIPLPRNARLVELCTLRTIVVLMGVSGTRSFVILIKHLTFFKNLFRIVLSDPVDGKYCQGCALLRKELKEVWFTYSIKNGIFQDFQDTSEPSNDNTNVVNTLQEPFVVKQDPGKNSSQSPPHINHHCCYGCGDSLEDIFCHQCICESFGKGAHYGYNCPPKVPIIPNPEPCNNQTIDELPQTLPCFDSTCYSGDENSFTYDSKSNIFDDSPNVFNPPPQPLTYSYEFCGNNAYYGHDCPLQVPFTYDPEPLHNDVQNIHEELTMYINTPSWDRPTICYNDDDDEECTIAITPILSTKEPNKSLSMGEEHLDTIPKTESDEFIKSSVENLVPIPSESEGIPENMCDVPFHDNSPPLDISKDQFEDFSENEDTIFDPSISSYHISSFMPDVSHRSGTFIKFNVYPKHLNGSPMEISFSTCSPMDQ
nr:hypothetical protein [Tanacetum cinerariifolium]